MSAPCQQHEVLTPMRVALGTAFITTIVIAAVTTGPWNLFGWLWTEKAAGWAQALGTVGAIVGAARLSRRQFEREIA